MNGIFLRYFGLLVSSWTYIGFGSGRPITRSLWAGRGPSRSNYGANVCSLEQVDGSGHGDLEERCLVKEKEGAASGVLSGGFSWTRGGAWCLVFAEEDRRCLNKKRAGSAPADRFKGPAGFVCV